MMTYGAKTTILIYTQRDSNLNHRYDFNIILLNEYKQFFTLFYDVCEA